MRVPAVRLVAVALAFAFAIAASMATHAQDRPSGFQVSTTAVVVDVVVRDGKGNPIVDLKPSDFELLEDDVKQRIASVELIAPGRARSGPTRGAPGDRSAAAPASLAPEGATATADAPPPAGPTLVALAFHRLSPEGRALAYRAARSYLETPERPDDYAGVFIVDTGLATLQTFTNDRARVAEAIEKAARTQTTIFTRHQAMSGLYGDASPDVSPTASAEQHGRPTNESGFQARPRRSDMPPGQGMERRLYELAERMERSFEEMMRERNGHAESAALTALASSMGSLPGRKTIVFFSEGMAVPAAIEAKYRAIIDTANRGNVSIYALDTKGLKVHSEQAATARGLAAIRGIGDDDPEVQAEDDRRRARTTDMERNEFLLRKDPAANLGTLAKHTGGFLIDNTNDLASAFQRIEADRRFHYLLTYTSTNTSMDGTYRRIAVKVKRRGADVRARSGYVAVPALGAVPVLRFEANALSALTATPRPTQVPLHAAAFQFPEADGTTRVALYVKAPGSGVAYFVDDNQTSWQTHFTILARVVDEKGETVRKGSQPYRLTGPAKDVHVARQGDILFYRQPTLDAGRYTLDYALYDELSGQAGTGALPIEIAARDRDALAMSSLVLVDHAEAVPEDQRDARNPLYLGNTLIYPNLGTPIARSNRDSLVFFYSARAERRPLTGRVELRQDGQVIAARALVVPPANADGLVQHANELPMDDVGAGRYELSVTLSDGRSSVTRDASFVLMP
jgi:VWFA-related protein